MNCVAAQRRAAAAIRRTGPAPPPQTHALTCPNRSHITAHSLTRPCCSDYYKTLYKDFPPADLDAHVAAVRASMRQPGHLRALRDQVFGLKAPCAARAPEVAASRQRVLAIWGDKDPDFADVKPEVAEMKRFLPQARCEVLPGVGHYPHAERPADVARLILEHFEGGATA